MTKQVEGSAPLPPLDKGKKMSLYMRLVNLRDYCMWRSAKNEASSHEEDSLLYLEKEIEDIMEGLK